MQIFSDIIVKMPSSKEDLALRWAQLSDEEKCEKRRRHAEAQKRYRARKAKQDRSEMKSEDIERKRALDRKNQQNRRINLSKEEKDSIRAKDRERKAKDRRERKKDRSKDKINKSTSMMKIDLHALVKRKLYQRNENCNNIKKLRGGRTEEKEETDNANLAAIMRERRSLMTKKDTRMARVKAKEGMRICRKIGYLKKYKQRKIRCAFDASMYSNFGVNKNGYSSLSWFYLKKQARTVRRYRQKEKKKRAITIDQLDLKNQLEEKKETLKRMNRIRVKRHRDKVRKMLQDPIIMEEYGEKGEYELLREENIREFERLKKESGMFD